MNASLYVGKQLRVLESLTATRWAAIITVISAMMIHCHWLLMSLRFTDDKVRFVSTCIRWSQIELFIYHRISQTIPNIIYFSFAQAQLFALLRAFLRRAGPQLLVDQ